MNNSTKIGDADTGVSKEKIIEMVTKLGKDAELEKELAKSFEEQGFRDHAIKLRAYAEAYEKMAKDLRALVTKTPPTEEELLAAAESELADDLEGAFSIS